MIKLRSQVLDEKIVETLFEHGPDLTLYRIGRSVGAYRSTVRYRLKKLEANGLAVRSSSGTYDISPMFRDQMLLKELGKMAANMVNLMNPYVKEPSVAISIVVRLLACSRKIAPK